MNIHFRIILVTKAETATFFLDADVLELPAVGDCLDLHSEFGPYDVLEVAAAPDWRVTCLVRNFEDDDIDSVPINFEVMSSDLADMARAGWKREQPLQILRANTEGPRI